MGVRDLGVREIAERLAREGYPTTLAAVVKFEAWNGTLEWTRDRLRTYGEFKVDLRPSAAQPL